MKEVYGIMYSENVRTLEVEIHPGDGTRYKFLVSEGTYHPDEFITIANVEGLASGYPLRRNSIKEAYSIVTQVENPRDDEHNLGEKVRIPYEDEITGEKEEREEFRVHHYVGYVASHIGIEGKKCNPWTARAAILAAYHAIKTWEEEDGRAAGESTEGTDGNHPLSG